MKPEPSLQKLRGGYYTPQQVARFLAEWAIRAADDHVLEPSAGDGNVLVAAAERLMALGRSSAELHTNLKGIELNPQEAAKARCRLTNLGVNIENIVETRDFFGFAKAALPSEPRVESGGGKYHVVIGNPPFIRYQNFPEEHRSAAFELMRGFGFNPNRLTNAWLPFMVLGAHLLTEDGRLAMVIPAELFQVKYAAEARQFISDYFDNVTLVTFKSLLFPNVQQEVVLLLGERQSQTTNGIRTLEVQNASDLGKIEGPDVEVLTVKPLDHTTEKWTKYFLSKDDIELLRESRRYHGVVVSGNVIDVDVGVVTGNNKFFILTQEESEDERVEQSTLPIVTRSAHLTGAKFSVHDWEQNLNNQLPSLLFRPADVDLHLLEPGPASYIDKGMRGRQHTGYKCRIRRRWYIVPSVSVPDAFLLRQVHGYPKLVLNESGATCTDTIHRVNFRNGFSGGTVAAAFVNSLTLAHAEVKGRSYGGGVLTFEPSEAEDLPLPLKNADQLDLTRIDELLRAGKIEEVLDITDKVLLQDGLGLSASDSRRFRAIWHQLRDRRLGRR